MNTKMTRKLYWYIAVLSTVAFDGCDKKVDTVPENPAKANYALTVTGGTYPNQTTYLFSTHDFPADGVGTSNAAELAGSGSLYRYGRYVYISTFGAPATL